MSLKVFGAICAAAGYFLVWGICGVLYQRAATLSDGDDFTFQGDIKAKAQIAAFREKTNAIADEGYIKAIIDHREHEKRCSNIIETIGDKEVLHSLCSQPMGFYWSLYYADIIAREGFTAFSTDVIPNQDIPSVAQQGHGRIPHWIVQRPGRPSQVDPFPIPEQTLEGCCFLVRLFLKKDDQTMEYKLLNVKQPEVRDGDLKYPELLATLFQDSISFPDAAIWHMQNVMQGAYAYPLMDFLYFSAVTITTVGFGDILPNSQYVRCVVMAETLLGTILIGLFISSLFVRS